MRAFARVSAFQWGCLAAAALVYAAITALSPPTQPLVIGAEPSTARPAAAAVTAAVTGKDARNVEPSDEDVISALAPAFSRERFEQELGEQFDALPGEVLRLLPPGFRQRFIQKFMEEGYEELQELIQAEARQAFDEEELRTMLDFHRQHPQLAVKQQQLAKKVMQRSMSIGQRLGQQLAADRSAPLSIVE